MSCVRRVVVLSLAWTAAGCVEGEASQPPENPGTYGPAAAGPTTIHVLAGSYGASCGQPRGNVTGHLSSVCEGRAEPCPYQVDTRVLGDPAYGCPKDYFAEWTCGAAPEVFQEAVPPEAGFGAVVTLSCPPIRVVIPDAPAAPLAVAPSPEAAAPPPAPAPPTSAVPAPAPVPPPSGPASTTPPIHVVAGSYGLNCRASRGNTTAHLQRSCEGRRECAYRVDYRVIGDPAYGCPKDYVAEWTCGADPTVRRAAAPPEAGLGSVVLLSCS